ncbi:NUDIX hydrolase [Halarsenatibacter silvermanii]|uniref:ADP-ribose pyrophosphatase YjhB, NUDIX family n=1 Tax=Halarsenatibacter silvermanii TaxID=321763 RepID=A0A1G9IYZ2_9FIRM|nr:NUDIX hydrolase N-terminal domain-containing protein [Halarsenatibacter silvermanii]SDL30236.1 ADP-ribose pyrophosphatase YjhB, NUDIX family [Halarsenatibacter silvermanii]
MEDSEKSEDRNKAPGWLSYARRLQTIAQAGLTYSENKYDRERFKEIQKIGAEILREYSSLEKEKAEDLLESEIGYPTPRVDVRAAIFRKGDILMVKEKINDRWSLPGGWADIEWSLKENLIKEAHEEAGVEINPRRIIGVFDRGTKDEEALSFYGIYKIFVECDFISMDFQENIETSTAKFYGRDDLPNISKERNTEEEIKLCFEARNKENFEAKFD